MGKILQKGAKLYLNTELDQKVFPLKKIFELKSLKITINFEWLPREHITPRSKRAVTHPSLPLLVQHIL